jgi:hypothetical protein
MTAPLILGALIPPASPKRRKILQTKEISSLVSRKVKAVKERRVTNLKTTRVKQEAN